MYKENWGAYHTKVFCDMCMEETQKDDRTLGCLNMKGYKHLEEKFFATTMKRLTKKHFLKQMGLVEERIYTIHGVETCSKVSWAG
jgi:hypothetical protein